MCVSTVRLIWGLCCQEQVSQAWISNYIRQQTEWCNYLSLPEIPASGNKVPICVVVVINTSIPTLKASMFCTRISPARETCSLLHPTRTVNPTKSKIIRLHVCAGPIDWSTVGCTFHWAPQHSATVAFYRPVWWMWHGLIMRWLWKWWGNQALYISMLFTHGANAILYRSLAPSHAKVVVELDFDITYNWHYWQCYKTFDMVVNDNLG